MSALLAYETRSRMAPDRRRPGRPGPRRYRRRFALLTPVGQQIASSWAARPAKDEFLCPRLDDIELPAGYRPVLALAEAQTVLEHFPDGDLAYDNSRRTRAALCRALADFLLPDTGLVVVGHGALGEHAARYNNGKPIPRATAGDHLRALEDAGALYVAFRGRSRQVAGRDLANVYVILAPEATLAPEDQTVVDELADRLHDQLKDPRMASVDEIRHLPFRELPFRSHQGYQARIAGHFPTSPSTTSSKDTVTETASSFRPRTILGDVSETMHRMPIRREHPEFFAARTLAEQRLCVTWLLHRHGWRYDENAIEQMLIVCMVFLRAGWSARALAIAFEHRPDGGEYAGPLPLPNNRDRGRPSQVRNLWAVLTVRLRSWLDPMGNPLPPPVESAVPRRGRPSGEIAHRRALIEQVEQLSGDDPRRVKALAVLRGEQPPSWQPRGSAAAADVEQLAQHLAQLAARQNRAEQQRDQRRDDLARLPGLQLNQEQNSPTTSAPAADRSELTHRRAMLRAHHERRQARLSAADIGSSGRR